MSKRTKELRTNGARSDGRSAKPNRAQRLAAREQREARQSSGRQSGGRLKGKALHEWEASETTVSIEVGGHTTLTFERSLIEELMETYGFNGAYADPIKRALETDANLQVVRAFDEKYSQTPSEVPDDEADDLADASTVLLALILTGAGRKLADKRTQTYCLQKDDREAGR
jgi:hypothetical protein